MKIDASTGAVAYHKEHGETQFNYAIDAHQAVSRHPDEWSFTPWTETGEKAAPVVVIPSDWQDLSATARINLALQISGEPRKGMTAAKADDIIQSEVDRRDDAPPADEQPKEPTA